MEVANLISTPLRTSLPSANVHKTQSRDDMRRIAQDFEASFLAQMMRPMFEGLKTDGTFGGGAGEEMWRGFLVEEMAKQTSRAGGVGLAETVLNHMIKVQEGSK